MHSASFESLSSLPGDPRPGTVERVVGNSVLYVSLADGTCLGLSPERLLLRTSEGLRRHGGEPFRRLGLRVGAPPVVVDAPVPPLAALRRWLSRVA